MARNPALDPLATQHAFVARSRKSQWRTRLCHQLRPGATEGPVSEHFSLAGCQAEERHREGRKNDQGEASEKLMRESSRHIIHIPDAELHAITLETML